MTQLVQGRRGRVVVVLGAEPRSLSRTVLGPGASISTSTRALLPPPSGSNQGMDRERA